MERNGERVCHRVHNPGFKVRVLVSLHAHVHERPRGLPGGDSGRKKDAPKIEETSEEKDRGNPQEEKNDPKKGQTQRGEGDGRDPGIRASRPSRQDRQVREGSVGCAGEARDSDRPRRRLGRGHSSREMDGRGKTPKGATGLDLEPVPAWKQNRTRAIWKGTVAKETPGDGDPGGGRGTMERREKTGRRLAGHEERTPEARGKPGSHGRRGSEPSL